VVRFTPRPLYLREKSSQYPLDRRLGGPQSRSGRRVKEKNSLPYPDNINIVAPKIRPVEETPKRRNDDFIGNEFNDFD
jgi:hypothetical protein